MKVNHPTEEKSTVKNEDIDALTFWILSNARVKDLSIPGTLLHEKVRDEKLGKIDFRTSSEWLMNFFTQIDTTLEWSKLMDGDSRHPGAWSSRTAWKISSIDWRISSKRHM